jgi:DNA mismatch endonuclease, patch repair protein
VVDVVTPAKRSQMMAGIGAKNTKPELLLRRGLHGLGLRFRLHRRDLPGKPDLVFPRHRAVLFVHGCFWHGHDCHLFKWPSSRPDFWREKIVQNQQRDHLAVERLRQSGWRVAEVWECALKGRDRLNMRDVLAKITAWLASDRPTLELHAAKVK